MTSESYKALKKLCNLFPLDVLLYPHICGCTHSFLSGSKYFPHLVGKVGRSEVLWIDTVLEGQLLLRDFFFLKTLPSDISAFRKYFKKRSKHSLPNPLSQCLQSLLLLSPTPLGSDALYTEPGQLALKPRIKPGQILASE